MLYDYKRETRILANQYAPLPGRCYGWGFNWKYPPLLGVAKGFSGCAGGSGGDQTVGLVRFIEVLGVNWELGMLTMQKMTRSRTSSPRDGVTRRICLKIQRGLLSPG
jgi:hypothetical protein